MDARRPSRPPHRDRGRCRAGRSVDPGAASAGRIRPRHSRRIRRPRRRPLRADDRGQAEARHGRRSRRIRAPHAHRSPARVIADHRRKPRLADVAQALGAAGRYPPCRAHEHAAFPSARLLLHRQRAGARHLRPSDRGLELRAEGPVRPRGRRPDADRALAGNGAHGARGETRQQGPSVLQAEALRLQQRTDRSLQVPLDVYGHDRRLRGKARDERRSARDPRRTLHPQDLARRTAAAHQCRIQGQSLAGRPAPACGARQGAEPAL